VLTPVLLKANYKVTTATSLVLTVEDLLASNLPLLFPELVVFNRTPTADTIALTLVRKIVYLNSTDPDFDGVVSTTLSNPSIGQGVSATLALGTYSLVPSNYGITHELTVANAGAALEARVSLVLRGMIESSVHPDPLVIQNV